MEIKCENNFNCVNCKNPCEIVDLFRLPEPFFNKIVMDSLKTMAGMSLASGANYNEVDQSMKLMAVTISLSRKQYLDKFHF